MTEVKKKEKTSRVVRITGRVTILTARIKKLGVITGRWHLPGAEGDGNRGTAAIAAACTAFDAALASLNEVVHQLTEAHAEGYDPKAAKQDARRLGRVDGTKTPKRAVIVGEVMALHQKAHAAYEGLLEESDLVALTVLEVRGNKVSVKAPSGSKLVVAASHLV